MGVASKKFLEKINNKLNNHLCDNQWHSTSTELIEKFINFARSFIEIQDKITDIINHARKSLLFHDGNTWFKKDGNPLFNVIIGSYDGGDLCELVGLYLLDKLAPLIDIKNVELYRDDGLAVIHQANGPKMDR